MSRPKTPVPLVEAIAQAFEAVGKLQRKGYNATRRYPFTRASDVFEAVRGELFKRRVLVLPTESQPEYVTIGSTNGGEQMTECRLAVTYLFRNALERLEPMVIHGVGRDVDDKAIYKAQTGAQKALLKRFGLMAEETDDPEFDGQSEATSETLDEVAPLRGPKTKKREQPIRDFEVAAIENACADTHKEAAEVAEVMCTRFQVTTVADLKRYQFKEALTWASNGAGTLAPKPQAAPATQSSMSFPKPTPSFEMRVGGKTQIIEPKTGSFSL